MITIKTAAYLLKEAAPEIEKVARKVTQYLLDRVKKGKFTNPKRENEERLRQLKTEKSVPPEFIQSVERYVSRLLDAPTVEAKARLKQWVVPFTFQIFGSSRINKPIIRDAATLKINGQQGAANIMYNVFLPTNFGPEHYEPLYLAVLSTVRHELEHVTQSYAPEYGEQYTRNLDTFQKDNEMLQKIWGRVQYALSDLETPAYVGQCYLMAKKEHKPFYQVAKEKAKAVVLGGTPIMWDYEQRRGILPRGVQQYIDQVYQGWIAYAKKRFPAAIQETQPQAVQPATVGPTQPEPNRTQSPDMGPNPGATI